MAKHNPFQVFRKNQKAWLASLTLFTMFSFIALGSMFQCLQVKNPQQQGQTDIAKTKTVGNLTYVDFINEQGEIQRLSVFLQAAVGALAQEKLITAQGNGLFTFDSDPADPKNQTPVFLDNLTVLMQELGMMAGGQNAAQNIVYRWLTIQMGQKEGLSPNEETISKYLGILFHNKLNANHLNYAMSQAGLNQDLLVALLSRQLIYDWMIRKADGGWRTDVFAALYGMPNGHGNIAVTPDENLEACRRLYQNVKTDVASFAVENYYDKIAEPTEEAINQTYEKYKNAPYSPESKDPGFYLPTKMAFEVIRGEVTDERLAAVTDEEIAAYYEANKANYAKPKATDNQATEDAAVQPGIEGAEDLQIPDELENGEAPAEDNAQGQETAPEASEPAEEQPTENQSTQNDSANPFRLVSYQEENAEPAAEEAAPEANAEPAAEEAAPEANAEPAVEEAAPEANAEPAAEEAASEANAESAAEEAASEESEYYSLDEVKDAIRRQLATEKLVKEMEIIRNQMADYSKKLANKRANVTAGTIQLEELDLAKMAEDAGYGYYKSAAQDGEGNAVPMMIDIREAASLKVLPESELVDIYAHSPMEFSPKMTDPYMGQVSLYWVTEVKNEHQPELDEVRDLVVETIKKAEALAMAQKDAKALAARVTGEKTLAAVAEEDGDAKNYEFAKSEKFTQFTFPRSFRNPSLSLGEICEEGVPAGEAERENKAILAPGLDFYDAAYSLELNGVTTVLNQPQDRVFVLQLTEKDADDTILEKIDNFGKEYLDQGALMSIRQLNNQKFQEEWMNELKTEAGFEWVSLPGKIHER